MGIAERVPVTSQEEQDFVFGVLIDTNMSTSASTRLPG